MLLYCEAEKSRGFKECTVQDYAATMNELFGVERRFFNGVAENGAYELDFERFNAQKCLSNGPLVIV